MCRHSLPLFAFLAAVLMVTRASAEDAKGPAKVRVYIGTATGKTAAGNESKGIYASELDLASGKLNEPVLVAEGQGTSFLALHPDGKHLYAVGAMRSAEGKSVGALSAFVIEDAKIQKIYTAMFYPPPELPVPNWPPYEGNWPLPAGIVPTPAPAPAR